MYKYTITIEVDNKTNAKYIYEELEFILTDLDLERNSVLSMTTEPNDKSE